MVQLLPMNNGQYGGQVTYESEAVLDGNGDVSVPATWPPAPEDRIDLFVGPSLTVADDASDYEAQGDQLDANGDWVESPNFPPNYEMLARSYRRSVGCFTWDVSGVDIEATGALRLGIDFGEFQGAWMFGIDEDQLADPGNPNYVASSGNLTSTNNIVLLDWIGGSFDDLDNFADILATKADQYPFTGSAATLDLMEIMPDPYGGGTGAVEQVIDVALSNWQDALAGNDWVSLVGSFADKPDVFWGWQDLITSRPDSTLYTMRNWIGFASQAFINVGNPVAGVWLDVVLTEQGEEQEDPQLLPPIALSATATFGELGMGLQVSGRAESLPDRRILTHAARRRRGW